MYKVKGREVKKRWIVLLFALAAISVLGLVVSPSEGLFEMTNESLWANMAWMITATIFVLMMTPGLSFFYGGMARAKNVISTMLQSFIVMGVVSVIWVVFGFGLAFGNDLWHVIGNPVDFFMFDNVGMANVTASESERVAMEEVNEIGFATTTIPLALFALFQMKFAIITPSLITGSFAERVRFSGYLFFMIFWVILVYCPLAHCTWHPKGLFAMMHVHDFAGGMGAAIGAVVGLVAITPCAGWVTVGESIFIAFVTTLCCFLAVTWKNSRQTFVDALDVFPTHGLGGIIGTVFTGIFAYGYFAKDDPEIISHWQFLLNHILVIGIVFAYTFVMSYLLYWITDKMIPMRVSRRSEQIGLDRSQHGEVYSTEASTELAEEISDEKWFSSLE